MGNAGSGGVPRDRQKLGETVPSSPCKEENQAFTFDKKPESILHHQNSQDDEEPYFTKPANRELQFEQPGRPRANTVSEGTPINVSDKTPTVFRWEGGGKEVYISGTFSEWKTIPMVKSHGDFVTIIDLPEGEHQYKFYVDGEWKNDPGTKVVENDIGTKNNQIQVRKSDFEVFQALDKDSENSLSDAQKEYSQEIPANKPWEKTSGPPVLPPHLLQVILNKDTPLSMPRSPEEWEQVAKLYHDKWNFPNCVGAIDGKHINIQAPIHSGSDFFNYKGYISIVLLAVVDANYNFLYANVACQGRISDGGVFNNTFFLNCIDHNNMHLPLPRPLAPRSISIPFVFVGDEAFQLCENIMKPFSGLHNKGS